MKFGMLTQFNPHEATVKSLKFLKMQDGGSRHIEK